MSELQRAAGLALAAALFAGCAKYAPVELSEPVRYAPLAGMPGLCTSFVPSAGRLPKADAAGWSTVRESLASGDLDAAYSAVSGLGDHPAKRSVALVHRLVTEGDPALADEVVALAEQYPDDGCLAELAGVSLLGVDPTRAREWILRARDLDPEDPDVQLLATALDMADPYVAAKALAELAEAQPTHAATQVLAARANIEVGDLDAAVVAFERAFALGIEDVEESLFHLRRMTGRIGPYLTQASQQHQPVTPVAFGEDPVADLEGWLGMKAETDEVRATLTTSLGDVHCTLFPVEAPVTVINFVALARGQQSWVDPKTGESTERKLYDGTVFHRVIPEFMIQGGDPLGTGEGFPGYRFRDELHPALRFDRPGRLAMANAGPDTNGSQFFITEVPTPHLDGMHTIFGQCDDLGVVQEIARVDVDSGDHPTTAVKLDSVTIEVVPCSTCTQ